MDYYNFETFDENEFVDKLRAEESETSKQLLQSDTVIVTDDPFGSLLTNEANVVSAVAGTAVEMEEFGNIKLNGQNGDVNGDNLFDNDDQFGEQNDDDNKINVPLIDEVKDDFDDQQFNDDNGGALFDNDDDFDEKLFNDNNEIISPASTTNNVDTKIPKIVIERPVMQQQQNREINFRTPSPQPVREISEKIRKWQEEQTKLIREKDANEEQQKLELREQAKAELKDWYAKHEESLAKTRSHNHKMEREFCEQKDAQKNIEPGTEWERICNLCDFNAKTSNKTAGHVNKDNSRMRSILLQLKQNPKPIRN